MDIATLLIDLIRNIKGFFFNKDGVLDRTRLISGSAVLVFLIEAIGYVTYRFMW